MRAVADTGPVHYLVLIGQASALPALLDAVILPETVRDELAHPKAPTAVREWIASPPPWISICPVSPRLLAPVDPVLDGGERATIALAKQIRPDLLLLDDRAGVAAAQADGFVVTGTLGLLVRAAPRNLVDLEAAFDALGRTSFHWTPALRDRLLAQHRNARG